MKNLRPISLVMLCLAFACESETLNETAEQNFYVYDSSEPVLITESFIIDFENFDTGSTISSIPILDPFENVELEGITMAFPNSNAAMIFDTSNPTGGDTDLGTPNENYGGPGIGEGGQSNTTAMGNVLILSEDLDANDPDDIFEIGASFVFDFSANDNVTLESFDILDIEESPNPTVVNLYDVDENLLFSKEIIPGGDNSKTTVDLEKTMNVAYMEIIMNSSGAIDNIAIEMEIEEPCVECDSNITELTFKYIGTNLESSIRFETLEGDVIFEGTLQSNEEFTITGTSSDGSFGSEIILFINNEQRATLITDCSQNIGPGFFLPSLEIIFGTTLSGGQLCPVEIFIG